MLGLEAPGSIGVGGSLPQQWERPEQGVPRAAAVPVVRALQPEGRAGIHLPEFLPASRPQPFPPVANSSSDLSTRVTGRDSPGQVEAAERVGPQHFPRRRTAARLRPCRLHRSRWGAPTPALPQRGAPLPLNTPPMELQMGRWQGDPRDEEMEVHRGIVTPTRTSGAQPGPPGPALLTLTPLWGGYLPSSPSSP